MDCVFTTVYTNAKQTGQFRLFKNDFMTESVIISIFDDFGNMKHEEIQYVLSVYNDATYQMVYHRCRVETEQNGAESDVPKGDYLYCLQREFVHEIVPNRVLFLERKLHFYVRSESVKFCQMPKIGAERRHFASVVPSRVP